MEKPYSNRKSLFGINSWQKEDYNEMVDMQSINLWDYFTANNCVYEHILQNPSHLKGNIPPSVAWRKINGLGRVMRIKTMNDAYDLYELKENAVGDNI